MLAQAPSAHGLAWIRHQHDISPLLCADQVIFEFAYFLVVEEVLGDGSDRRTASMSLALLDARG